MVDTLPLLCHADLSAPLAYRADGVVTVGDFLNDVQCLATQLPSARYMLNICGDRYRFMVGLVAGMTAGTINLLPSTHTPETIRQLRDFAQGNRSQHNCSQDNHSQDHDSADIFCLSDREDSDIDLPTIFYRVDNAAAGAAAIPHFPAQQIVAYVFTSGTTGTPVAHAKTWGALVQSTRAEAARLGMLGGRAFSIVGTVPAQHMYGFESTVLLAMHSGAAFWTGKPFYAADIVAALAAVPEPRLLVSTPFHLRMLLAEQLACPALAMVLSATAPLAPELARDVENALAAPLLEIYGCTESGQLASRRPTQHDDWQLLPNIGMDIVDDEAWVYGGHIEKRLPLADIIEKTATDRFVLRGRSADLINIAGKRTSLAFLNHQLLEIPGIVDGVFVVPDLAPESASESAPEKASGLVRLAALVVAPTLSAADILQALRERIDPLFLPRPLLLVDNLPRNAAGKLPRAALQELVQRQRNQHDDITSAGNAQ